MLSFDVSFTFLPSEFSEARPVADNGPLKQISSYTQNFFHYNNEL